MIGSIAAWWIASTAAGAAAFPITWRLFDRLPDRGFGLSRAFGILLGGYLLWLTASAGILSNNPAGAVAAMLAVAAGGFFAGRGHWRDIGAWLRANSGTVLAMEALFLVAFVAWAVVRSFNPEIVATEKPMELAFINAILRSPQFPPQDPWLSGNAISYYYLGYVLVVWMTWLTGVSAGVAFNLANALWFALVAVGAYSIAFNLISLRRGAARRLAALLGPLLVVVVGNLAGVFEVMHSQHWFWETQPDGSRTSAFWTWLNLNEGLTTPPAGDPVFPPNRFWWWWQGARVVSDINLIPCPPENLECNDIEVIDEFPFFSFLLADNHPHVLALPFAVMALAVALQAFRAGRREGFRLSWVRLSSSTLRTGFLAGGALVLLAGFGRAGMALGAGTGASESLGLGLRLVVFGAVALGGISVFLWVVTGRAASALPTRELVVAGWLSGALAFLNTWDLPIYLVLILAAGAWASAKDGVWTVFRRAVWTGAAAIFLAVVSVALWIPTFASQAGGILPNLIFPTRLPQFLIMFLVLLLPVGLWLIQRTASEVRRAGSWKTVVAIAIGLPLALFLLSWVLAGVVTVAAPDFVQSGLIGLGASSLSELAAVSVARRLDAPSVAVLLSLVLALGYLFLRRAALGNGGDGGERSLDVFAVLMVILGAALVLVPEFFYLRDSFGTRMNTVFKFYYAAWLLWAMAAAYMLAWPWESFGRWGRPLLVVAVLPLILGLIYTTTALWEKTSQFSVTGGPQLDGTAHLDLASPQDANAIRWMRAALTPAVVAEAVGGSYTQYGRISAHTGFPTVLGWEFHEYQWRGDWTPQGTRNQDIARLYTSKDWQEAQSILERYDIRYVYVGPLERSTYTPVATAKFDLYMTKLYEQGDVTIYGRREQVGA